LSSNQRKILGRKRCSLSRTDQLDLGFSTRRTKTMKEKREESREERGWGVGGKGELSSSASENLSGSSMGGLLKAKKLLVSHSRLGRAEKFDPTTG